MFFSLKDYSRRTGWQLAPDVVLVPLLPQREVTDWGFFHRAESEGPVAPGAELPICAFAGDVFRSCRGNVARGARIGPAFRSRPFLLNVFVTPRQRVPPNGMWHLMANQSCQGSFPRAARSRGPIVRTGAGGVDEPAVDAGHAERMARRVRPDSCDKLGLPVKVPAGTHALMQTKGRR